MFSGFPDEFVWSVQSESCSFTGMDPDQKRGCRHGGDFHFLNRFKGHAAEGESTNRWNRSFMPTRPSEMPGAEHRVGVTNRPEQAL
jgi:hypothetical protein